MRYHTDHKEQTRQRVIEAASARFRKDGLEGVGVATLMSDAGLTHGGFYSHFKSKEALIKEVMESGAEDNFARISEAAQKGGIDGLVACYLRPAHRDHPERGCAAAALGAEIARRPTATRAAFTRKFQRMVTLIDSVLPQSDPATAQAIFATLVGTLQLSRSVAGSVLSDQILAAGQQAALALAHRPA